MGRSGRRGIILVVAGAALAAVAVFAGTVFDVSCGTRGCGFKAQVGLGGGRASEQISGYCSGCAKPASLAWARGAAPPKALAQFWDPLSGTRRSLYACPKCKGPFVALASIQEFRHCPKCGKAPLATRQGILFD